MESQYDSSDDSASSSGEGEEVLQGEEEESGSLAEEPATWLEEQTRVLQRSSIQGVTEGEEQTRVLRRCSIQGVTEGDLRQAERERSNAATYHKLLRNRMFRLNSIRSAVEIDQKIQEFASAYCQDFSAHSPKVRDKEEVTIMNADGIYLTTYRVIHLNTKLRKEGHYSQAPEDQLPSISESEFTDSILQSGIIAYLSSTWLAEVYSLVLQQDLFEGTTSGTPIVNLCSDIDGYGSTEEHGQLLKEYRRLQEGQPQEPQEVRARLAGRKYCRRIVSAVWDYTISICSKVTSGSASSAFASGLPSMLGTRKAKSGRAHLREAHLLHLRVLQALLRLCRRVGYQQLSGSVFCLLSTEVGRGLAEQGRKKGPRVTCATLLALEAVVSQGLELASHSPDCWKHIFRCCQLLARLEQVLGKLGSSASPRISAGRVEGSRNSMDSMGEARSPAEEIFMGLSTRPREDEIQDSLSMLLIEAKVDITGNEFLKEALLARCVTHLTQKMDKLLCSASSNLNLMSFLGYLRELCFQSHKELLLLSSSSRGSPNLLVSTLCEALLRSVKAGRSLLHIMLAWAVAAPHLLEAASHAETRVSRIALLAIHDVISTLLQHQSEMPYFHFHESLFKPYETLVLLELADPDVQDQVVASIQQFVEGSPSEIRSGWRPLFGTLRSIQTPGAVMRTASMAPEPSHISAILDVFEGFLSTDSPVVFAHAALDCIMCLVKHVKGTKEVLGEEEELVDIHQMLGSGFSDAALGYIVRCHSVLAKMFLMASCPVFRGAEKIHTGSQPVTVSCLVPNCEVISFDPATTTLEDSPHSYELLNIPAQSPAILQESGLLKVWFLLIDGVVSALTGCPIRNQSGTITTFFSMLRSLMKPPYSEFGLFCVNHLLLPGLQTWLRTASSSATTWPAAAQGLKQTIGLTTDLVLDWLLAAQIDPGSQQGAGLMLKQLVVLLTECAVVAWESIARLGCSCFRHLLSVGSQQLEPGQLEVVVLGLVRAAELSLHPLHQLMASFRPGSENFYGDLGTVRVAARRDSSVRETNRMRQLAQQMLLLEGQREDVPSFQEDPKTEDRSYLFLLQPLERRVTTPTEDTVTVRVTLGQILTGLTAHHLLQQVVGSALLPSARAPLPPLLASYHPTPASLPLPGPLLTTLLLSLRTSHRTALALDSRPGLKFLLQKVAQLPGTANLYSQAAAAWSVSMCVLFDLCLERLGEEEVLHTKGKGELTAEGRVHWNLQEAWLELCQTYLEMVGMDGDVESKESLEDVLDKLKSKTVVAMERGCNKKESSDVAEKEVKEPDQTLDSKDCEPNKGQYGLSCETNGNVSDIAKKTENAKNSVDMEEPKMNKVDNSIHVPECGVNQRETEEKREEREENKEGGMEVTKENTYQKKKSEKDMIINDSKHLQGACQTGIEEIEVVLEEISENHTKKSDNTGEVVAGNHLDVVENVTDKESEPEKNPIVVEEETAAAPFSFSDFTLQPNRPDSPNMSEGSEVEQHREGLVEETNDDVQVEVPEAVLDENQAAQDRPSQPALPGRRNPFIPPAAPQVRRGPPVDPEISRQRTESLAEDSRARERVWHQLVIMVLERLDTTTDTEFKVSVVFMTPVTFSCRCWCPWCSPASRC